MPICGASHCEGDPWLTFAYGGDRADDPVQRVAIAIRQSYDRVGTATRQHNEPAGNQDVWHLRMHVFPRYAGDDLYASKTLAEFATAEQRRPYARRLRAALRAL